MGVVPATPVAGPAWATHRTVVLAGDAAVATTAARRIPGLGREGSDTWTPGIWKAVGRKEVHSLKIPMRAQYDSPPSRTVALSCATTFHGVHPRGRDGTTAYRALMTAPGAPSWCPGRVPWSWEDEP
ncbi:hypothetical protein GCM10023335_10670 [Streptomyces siamensis]|uniref:Secreted protein n=1 Tax=Streptomyces siamensis TaxID=1274986 RepID=A0ABP9IIF5_9ACTN